MNLISGLWSARVRKDLRKNSRLPIEVHLAVYDIENYIEVFAQKKVVCFLVLP